MKQYITLCLILSFTNTYSQWIQCDSPFGSTIEVIENNGSVILAGNYNGNIYRSDDVGNSWNRIITGQYQDQCQSIKINGAVWMIANKHSLFLSNDAGQSWNTISSAISTSGTFTYFDLVNGSLIAITSKSEFFESTDNGNSWVFKNNFQNTGSFGDTIIRNAAGNGTDLIVVSYSGIFKSNDNAASWTTVNLNVSHPIKVKYFNGAFYVCGNSGVYRSYDNGLTWSHIFNTTSIKDIAVSGTGLSLVAQNSIYRSVDNGSTWTHNHLGKVNYTMTDDGTNLYLGVFGSGIYKSTDSGLSWNLSNSGINHQPPTHLISHLSTIFVSAGTGVYESSDSGATWNVRNFGLPEPFNEFILSDGSYLYTLVNNQPGIYKSTDNGNNWSLTYSGNEYFKLLELIGPNIIAQGHYNSTLKYTNDYGISWNNLGSTYGTNTYSKGIENSLFVSVDYGMHDDPKLFYIDIPGMASWSAYTPTRTQLNKLTGSLSNLFAIFQSGTFWISSDTGKTWTQPAAAMSFNFNDIVYSGNTLYASTEGNGIISSNDNGQSWNTIPSPSPYIGRLFIAGSSLYATVWNEGLFVNHTLLTNINSVEATEFTISPNPGSGIYNIQLKESIVDPSVTVYNLTGEQIPSKLVQNDINQFRLEFNAVEGIYFIRVGDGIKQYSQKIVLSGR